MLYLLALVLLSWFSEFQAAVQLPQTESGGWITIDEDTQYSITCNGFDEGSTVTWSLIHPDNTITNIGSCAPSQTSCPSSYSNFQLSRNTSQESLMKINSGHRTLIGTSVKCAQGTSNAATAKFHIIRRGTIGECETRKDYTTTWTLSINCRIQDAFSSNNRYSCNWYLKVGNQYTSKTTDFHPDSAEAGDQLISGNCNITWGLPTSDDVYTYYIKFSPGPASAQTVTNVSIRSPQAPHTAPNCPDYVAENDTVTCDCVTTDPGSPPSEIRWLEFTSHQLIVHNVTSDMTGTVYTCLQTWKSRAFANVTYTLHVTAECFTPSVARCPRYVEEGDTLTCTCTPGDCTNSQVTVTWPNQPPASDNTLVQTNVSREDNGTQFTCQMVCGGETSNVTYTLQAGYGPSEDNVFITGNSTLITNGFRLLNLTCVAREVNPVPVYSWLDPLCQANSQGSTCSFRPQIPWDDNQTLICRVTDNFRENPFATTKEVTLNLTYPPTETPRISGYTPGQIVTTGDTLTCTVTGGKPLVSDVMFYCLNPEHNDQNDTRLETSVSSSLVVNTSQAAGKDMVCKCSATWAPQTDFYTLTSVVTIPTSYQVKGKTEDNQDLAIILGVVVPVALIIIVAVVVVVCFVRQKRSGKRR